MISVDRGHVSVEGTGAVLHAELATLIHAFCIEGICTEEEAMEFVKHAFHPELLEQQIEEKIDGICDEDEGIGSLLKELYELLK